MRIAIATLIVLCCSCAMDPKVMRSRIDECTQYEFDTIVYRRSRDGAVVRVLCIPEDEEMDIQVKQPAVLPFIIKRLVPLIE